MHNIYEPPTDNRMFHIRVSKNSAYKTKGVHSSMKYRQNKGNKRILLFTVLKVCQKKNQSSFSFVSYLSLLGRNWKFSKQIHVNNSNSVYCCNGLLLSIPKQSIHSSRAGSI